MDKIGILIVNYNSSHHLINCINSFGPSKKENFEFYIFDNFFSVEEQEILLSIRDNKSFKINLILSEKNIGFGKANNILAKNAQSNDCNLLWILNNDTIVTYQTLYHLTKSLGNQCNQILGCVIKNADQDGTIQCFGGGRIYFPIGYTRNITELHKLKFLDYIHGASIFIRTDDFFSIGGFDERFFMYWEDVDFGLRAKKHGFHLNVCLEAELVHLEGGSIGRASPSLEKIYTTSAVSFFLKIKRYPTLFLFLTVRIMKRFLKGDLAAIISTFRGVYAVFRKSVG